MKTMKHSASHSDITFIAGIERFSASVAVATLLMGLMVLVGWALLWAPFGLRWVQQMGQNKEWHGMEFGFAIFATFTIFVLALLGYWTAHLLDQRNAENAANLTALRDSEERLRLAWQATRDVIWDWDIVHDSQRWSPMGAEVFGWRDAFTTSGTSDWWAERVHPEDRPRVMAGFHALLDDPAHNHWEDEYRFRRANGSYAQVLDRGSVIRDDQGKPIRMIGAMQDITERKQAEEALRNSEHRLQRFYDSGLLGVIYWNMDGQIMDANDKFLEMVGYDRKDLAAGRIDWQQMTPPEYRYLDEKGIRDLLATGVNAAPFEKEYIRKDGTRLPIILAGAMLDEAQFNGVAFVLDISERKQAEEDLRESQMDLNRAQAVARIGSWRLDVRKNRLDWSDENFRIFGVPIGSTLTYESFLEIVHPSDREVVDKAWKAALKGKPYDIEHRLIVEQKVKWVRELAELEFDEQGALRGGFGTTQDITAIKLIQEELEQERAFLRQVIDATPSIIFVKNREGKFLLGNEALAHMYGTRPKDLIGFTDDHFNSNTDELAHIRQDDLEIFATRKPKFIPQEKVTHSDGSVHWFSTVKIPLFDGDQCTKLLGVATDITERKRAEEELLRLNTELEQRVLQRTVELQRSKEKLMVSLKEKEVLLKEIHHRVKNNLQIIASLLQLQSDFLIDPVVRELFLDSKRRIRSMALIHEQLSKGKDLANIDLLNYITRLVNSIQSSYARTTSDIGVRIEIPSLSLNIDQALPLGLIISELVSNSFKHAFFIKDSSQRGELWVTVNQEPSGGLTLEVGDSGRGLPKEVDIEQVKSMGLQLVHSFVLQLNGQLTVQCHPGTRFCITIPGKRVLHG
jgi:PAS domain S-box-containing protein